MALRTLRAHRKMARLAALLGSEAAARGHLELLWEIAFQNGSPVVGDAHDVEMAARWHGAAGELVTHLVGCGGPSRPGFLDPLEGGLYQVHDFWDHCPEFVRKRRLRELERTSGVPYRELAEMHRVGALDLAAPPAEKALRKLASRKGSSWTPAADSGRQRHPAASYGGPSLSLPSPIPSGSGSGSEDGSGKTLKSKTTSGAARSAKRALSANQLEIQAAEQLYRDHDLEPPAPRVLVAMRKQAGGGEGLLATLRAIGAPGLRMGVAYVHGACLKQGRGEHVNGHDPAASPTAPTDHEEDPFDALDRRLRAEARARQAGLDLPG